jgi:RNA polymerase sigma-70 factor (ECF subfamily)
VAVLSNSQSVAMPAPHVHDVTALLADWRNGNVDAMHRLLPLVHGELRRLAARQMAGERPGHLLAPTGLVNEAYLRLVDLTRVQWRDRAHFFAVASGIMRRVLVDFARAQYNLKRGGQHVRVTFNDDLPVAVNTPDTLIAVHDALEAFTLIDARKSRVVEMRFFGGLSVEEIAAVLDVSPETVKRDWKFAKAWLAREMAPDTQ